MPRCGGHRPIRSFPWRANPAVLNGIVADAYGRPMSIIATIMNSATGQPIQKMTFQRMPKPWVTFHLATGEMVTAERVNVGKPAPVKFIAPVEIWVTPKSA